jgi:hypothetical protein
LLLAATAQPAQNEKAGQKPRQPSTALHSQSPGLDFSMHNMQQVPNRYKDVLGGFVLDFPKIESKMPISQMGCSPFLK